MRWPVGRSIPTDCERRWDRPPEAWAQEGVKKGITTTLPVALGILQSEGEIRRIPINGRLDQQRYRYALWRPNPLATSRLSGEEALTEVGRKYFGWIGPATMAEFQWFAGVSVKVAKAVLEPLGLQSIETSGGTRLMLASDRDAFESFRVPRKPEYSLVGSLDSMNALRRNLPSLVAPEDVGHVTAKKGQVDDLPDHAIFDRGRLVGLWEFDTATNSIAWMSFGKADAALREAVQVTEAWVRDELGDARRASLDSPQSPVPRVEALRKAAAS